MRDIFAVEFGNEFASSESLYPSFYSQDLIVFGLENKIAEAVRLGEKMMSENGYTLSREMSMAVKNFLLDHQSQYAEAIKRTGPIDNSSLYRKASNNGE